MAILLPFNKVFPNGVAWVPCGVTWLRRVDEFQRGRKRGGDVSGHGD